jgi:hypothetical protein
MDFEDGLMFLASLALLPIAGCTKSDANDDGTTETTTPATESSGGGPTSTGSASGSTTGGDTDPTTTTAPTTTSGETTTTGEPDPGDTTWSPCEDTEGPVETTGGGCGLHAQICSTYALLEAECDGDDPGEAYSYCMHYVDDGGYRGEPCIPIAEEYFTCLGMLECGEVGDCDQKALVEACGHA